MLSHRNGNKNSKATQSYTNVRTNERYILLREMGLKLNKGDINKYRSTKYWKICYVKRKQTENLYNEQIEFNNKAAVTLFTNEPLQF